MQTQTSPPTIKKCNSKNVKPAPSFKTACHHAHSKTQARYITSSNNHMCIRKPHLHNPIPEIQNTPTALAEYIGQKKRALHHRFGEQRRAIQNKTTNAVPQHFNQKGHKLTDMELIPLELINSKRESIRRARKSFYIDKAKTMQPHGWYRQRR